MALRKGGVEPIYVCLGERIAALRKEQGLTQQQLGMRAGVSANYLARTEGAYHRANLAQLELIAGALGVSLAALFHNEPDRKASGVSPSILVALMALGKQDEWLLVQLARRLRVATGRRMR